MSIRPSKRAGDAKQKTPPTSARPPQKAIKMIYARAHHLACLLAAAALLVASASPIEAQDLLRRTSANNNNNKNNHLLGQQQQPNPLANIQLPPQLASLTPQQLHQLAQLRELQLQQEAAAAGRQRASEASTQQAPAPLGLEAVGPQALPTAQPAAGQSSGQIPQPNGAETTPLSGSGGGSSHERHDDGSYNESGSEMEGVAMSTSGSGAQSSSSSSPAAAATGASNSAAQESGESAAAGAGAGAPAAPSFEVNWNKCPQLEPSENEKNKKTQVITKCLQSAPIPANLTRENVEAHREQIATCALKVEGWFDEHGQYRYDKAEAEIRGKRLEPAIETQVLKFHVACRDEASKKFPRDQNKLIDQVQFYQACMDYYISIVCEIEVSVDQ
jgi:hypothetical protein